MFLSKFATHKPISTIMIYLIIIVIAIFALLHLPLSFMPNLSYPKLTVYAYWAQASPEEVESRITAPIESIGSSIAGITNIKSSSHQQYASIEFEFSRETDMNYAKFKLNEKLQLLKGKLPDNVTPRIREYIPDEFQEDQFLSYGIAGPYKPEEMENYIDRYLKYRLLSVNGIADVNISGKRKKIIRVILDEDKTNILNISLIKKALKNHGKNKAISFFEEKGLNYILQIDDDYDSFKELKTLKIRTARGEFLPLEEIAAIREEYLPAYTYLRYNGHPQLTLNIDKKATANAINLSKVVKSIVNQQKKYFPDDISIVKLSDESKEIAKNLNVLYKRGFFALLFIFLILLIFLRHPQSSFLVLTTIFFSIALTFILLYFLKISLNMLSLAGLTLGFGMIVDNSIVVYENIFRFQNKGYDKKTASILGVKEVAAPIFASTLTTIIVFAPFLYLQGDFKLFYLPFVYATVLSLLSSLFVSFTFIPLIAYKFLNLENHTRVKKNRGSRLYRKLLAFLIRFRWLWLFLVIGFLVFSVWIFITKVDKGTTWRFPDRDYLSIYISLPVGSNIDQADNIAQKFEEKILTNESVTDVKTKVRSDYAYIRVDFDEASKKTAYPLITREKLKAFAVNFGNSTIYIRGFGPSFGGGGYSTANFSLRMFGYNYDTLKNYAHKLAEYMQQISRRVTEINVNATGWWQKEKLYEYVIKIDRNKVSKFNFDIYQVVMRLFSLLNSDNNRFDLKIANEEYLFSVEESKQTDYYEIEKLKNLLLVNELGKEIPFYKIADISQKEIIPEIVRENKLYKRRINFDYRGSYRKGEEFIEQIKENFQLPLGYYFKLDNDQDEDMENKQLIYLLIFSVVLVFMSLCSLYESFKFPLIIIIALPLAFTGVSLIFHLTEETFSPYARIGLVLLVGIVVNNSIILVYHINQLRERKYKIMKAVLKAAQDRIRPILMTTLTTITGLLPMLLQSQVSGNDFWRLLSLSTIGGLITSTFFVLTFIPVMYYFFARKTRE